MRHVILSLFVAFGFAIVGAGLMKPVVAHKVLLGPDGQIMRKPDGQPVLARDRYREFRVNLSGFLCFAGAAVSLAWAVFLVAFGVVTSFRQRPQPAAAPLNGGPTTPVGNSGAGEGPPSVS